MERRKKILKRFMIALAVAAALIAAVGIELGLNALYRSVRTGSAEPFDRTGLEAVGVNPDRVPQIGTEQSNAAAAVLWVTSFMKGDTGLTESKIVEETGGRRGEYELYAALETYMPNAKREQRRNMTDAETLKVLYERLGANCPAIATVSDGAGGAKYAVVTAFDPQNGTVSVYDLEAGAVKEISEAEFLKSLKLENPNSNTINAVIFGKITPNNLMLIY